MRYVNSDLAPEASGLYSNRRDWHIQARVEAQRRFDQARHSAWLRRVWAALSGRSSTLRRLSDTVDSRRFTTQTLDGLHSVHLAQIVGSEGRSQDFDSEFAPLGDHLRERWVTIASLWAEGYPLPPVELLQIGSTFYVLDGHHRISVARAFSEETIEARVAVCLGVEEADLACAASAETLCVSGRI